MKGKKGMEVNQLYQFVLLIVLVGMVIGVGILVLDNYAANVYYTREDYNDTTDIAANSTLVALDYGNITETSVYVKNGSDTVWPGVCYTLNNTPGQIAVYIFDNVSCGYYPGMDLTVIYDYKEYQTETLTATVNARAEVGRIASDWIGLIVTIVVLSIILLLVLRSFTPALER